MLNFIRRWLFNRSRYVFSYWNGSRIVKADPMVLWRAMQQHEDFREEDFRLMQVEALRSEMLHKISGVVSQVFSIALPDKGGLTEMECMDVLRSYIEYTGFQKKSGGLTQTWQQPTDQPVSPDLMPEQSMNDDSESI